MGSPSLMIFWTIFCRFSNIFNDVDSRHQFRTVRNRIHFAFLPMIVSFLFLPMILTDMKCPKWRNRFNLLAKMFECYKALVECWMKSHSHSVESTHAFTKSKQNKNHFSISHNFVSCCLINITCSYNVIQHLKALIRIGFHFNIRNVLRIILKFKRNFRKLYFVNKTFEIVGAMLSTNLRHQWNKIFDF